MVASNTVSASDTVIGVSSETKPIGEIVFPTRARRHISVGAAAREEEGSRSDTYDVLKHV